MSDDLESNSVLSIDAYVSRFWNQTPYRRYSGERMTRFCTCVARALDPPPSLPRLASWPYLALGVMAAAEQVRSLGGADGP